VFTGIVQAASPVNRVVDQPGLRSFTVALPTELRQGLSVGASVAVAGVCLTVTAVEPDGGVVFDAIRETQERTTLGSLRQGDRVNVERSARAGDEIGGHEVSGHVDATAEIVSVERTPGNHVVTFRAPLELVRYIFPKGFVALDGCSLTVVAVDREAGTFTVHLIPETLRVTTFGNKGAGDRVNLEIERRTQIIVETVRDVVRELVASGGLALAPRAAPRAEPAAPALGS
jgi:riboflavin synthase